MTMADRNSTSDVTTETIRQFPIFPIDNVEWHRPFPPPSSREDLQRIYEEQMRQVMMPHPRRREINEEPFGRRRRDYTNLEVIGRNDEQDEKDKAEYAIIWVDGKLHLIRYSKLTMTALVFCNETVYLPRLDTLDKNDQLFLQLTETEIIYKLSSFCDECRKITQNVFRDKFEFEVVKHERNERYIRARYYGDVRQSP